jgi:hypothetical protein
VEIGARERVPRLGPYVGIPCPGVKARVAVGNLGERVKGREEVGRAKDQGTVQEELLLVLEKERRRTHCPML